VQKLGVLKVCREILVQHQNVVTRHRRSIGNQPPTPPPRTPYAMIIRRALLRGSTRLFPPCTANPETTDIDNAGFEPAGRLASLSSSPATGRRRHVSTHPKTDLSQGQHPPEHPQQAPANGYKKRPLDWESPMGLKDDFDLLQRFRACIRPAEPPAPPLSSLLSPPD